LPVLEVSAEKQVDAMLENVEDWDFNMFQLAELTKGRPLFFIAYSLFNRYDLIRKFSIDETKLKRFLTIIEDGYDSKNPYHNSIHAADVLQTLNCFISKGKMDIIEIVFPFSI
jgi:cAMP-specific phosphodiesterase 4